MYTENLKKDICILIKAFFSNQLAKYAPSVYVRLVRDTGRGNIKENSCDIADYFLGCFNEYFYHLGLKNEESKKFLLGKKVLEYGPGDVLGVALLMYAYGANKVDCIDRFPLRKISEKNLQVYKAIIDRLDNKERKRAQEAFLEIGKLESGFKPEAINYFVMENGLCGKKNEYDLIISRSVLEHVNDLEKTLYDISHALKEDGVSIHKVDLKSHELDRYQVFDFLTWPESIYHLLYSHKGFPNRWRIDKYRKLFGEFGLHTRALIPTGKLDSEKLEIIKPKLAKPFRQILMEDLSWLGFWVILEHAR